MQEYHFFKTYCFLCLLILTFSCNERPKEIQKRTFAKGEVVSSLPFKVWDIFQDQKGNYWFGSNGDGVFFFDGKQLIQYTKKDGLIDNAIRSIQGDHLGNVFIGTPEGVSKYDGKGFVSLTVNHDSANEWKLKPTDLWFNCNGNALYRYDGQQLFDLSLPPQDLKAAFGTDVSGVSFPGMNNSPYAVYGLNKDKAGNLWIGTITAGAFRYDGESFLWIGEKELSTLPDGRVPGVRSMIEDKDGHLWLSNFISKYRIKADGANGAYEKLVGIDPSNELFQQGLPYFNSGLADTQGNLWMTTYGGGVWKYDGEQILNFPIYNGVTEALIVSIYQDTHGVLWLGTDNVGVFRFNGEDFERFEPVKGYRID